MGPGFIFIIHTQLYRLFFHSKTKNRGLIPMIGRSNHSPIMLITTPLTSSILLLLTCIILRSLDLIDPVLRVIQLNPTSNPRNHLPRPILTNDSKGTVALATIPSPQIHHEGQSPCSCNSPLLLALSWCPALALATDPYPLLTRAVDRPLPQPLPMPANHSLFDLICQWVPNCLSPSACARCLVSAVFGHPLPQEVLVRWVELAHPMFPLPLSIWFLRNIATHPLLLLSHLPPLLSDLFDDDPWLPCQTYSRNLHLHHHNHYLYPNHSHTHPRPAARPPFNSPS